MHRSQIGCPDSDALSCAPLTDSVWKNAVSGAWAPIDFLEPKLLQVVSLLHSGGEQALLLFVGFAGFGLLQSKAQFVRPSSAR